jgi:invasion protein IalB
MRPFDRRLRLLVHIVAPLVALSLTGASLAASGGGDLAAASASPGVKLAQQGKASPSAPPAKGAPAQPQPPAQPQQEAAAWAVTCTDQGQKKFTCEMTQSLIDQKSNMQILLISIKSVATGESKAMLVRFFHGVYLPTGVSVKVDNGQATPIAFQKSDRLGVYAALPLTDRIVADMKRGKDLRFSVQINQGEPLEVVGRLTGFGPAYDRLSSMQ